MSRTRQCDTDPLNRARRTLVPGFEAEAVRAPEEGRRLGRGRGRGLDSLSMRARARTRGMARGSSEQRRQRGEAAERRREKVAFSKTRLRVTTHQIRTPAPDAQASPRWSSGYDSALSQPRAGFDSPSGNHKRALRRVLLFFAFERERAISYRALLPSAVLLRRCARGPPSRVSCTGRFPLSRTRPIRRC